MLVLIFIDNKRLPSSESESDEGPSFAAIAKNRLERDEYIEVIINIRGLINNFMHKYFFNRAFALILLSSVRKIEQCCLEYMTRLK